MSNRSRFFADLSALLCVLGLLAVVLGGCSEHEANAIRFGLATPPVNLDPRFATDATSYRIGRLIFQSLVDFDAAQKPIAALAHWELVSATHYRFHLKRDQRFHHDQLVTSADVVATYRSVLDPASISPHRGSLANVHTVVAADTNTVDFHLLRPDPLFPGLLVIGILPASSIDDPERDKLNLIGSGPFALEPSSNDTRVNLRRISDGQAVQFITVRDATVRALKLVHGEIDLIQGSMTPEIVAWLEKDPDIHALRRPGTTFTYLGFNLADPVTDDARVRQAIAYGIDRDALVKYLFGGRARPAEAIFPPTHWAGNDNLARTPYDPDAARRILAELGFSPQAPLKINYKTSSDHFRLRVATSIQDQLADIGIEMTISSYDWGTFYADIKSGRFQMYSLSWVGLKQPDIFRYVFHSTSVPPEGANRGRYASTVVDELIAAAEVAIGLDKRAAFYRQIQKHIQSDLPYVPLWYEDNILLYRNSISGYDTGIDGYYDALIETQMKVQQ